MRALVGIAAAPDFTRWGFTDAQKAVLVREGALARGQSLRPRADAHHTRLLGVGRGQSGAGERDRARLPGAAAQGQRDPDVPWEAKRCVSPRGFRSADVRTLLVKDGDHRLSRESDIALLVEVAALVEFARLSLIAALIFAQAGAYSPEIEAVMRDRKPPVERRAAASPLPAALPPEVAKRLEACTARANDDAAAGVAQARQWQAEKGGAAAALCLGYALDRQDKWPRRPPRSKTAQGWTGSTPSPARLWSQAGNAALIAGDAKRALAALDAALAEQLPATLATGEIHLDRARARVARDDLPGARVDMNEAVRLAAADPLAWLLSATLARHMNDLPLARAHIAEAARKIEFSIISLF